MNTTKGTASLAMVLTMMAILGAGTHQAAAADADVPIDPNLTVRADKLITEQAAASLALVDETLRAYPPGLPDAEQRKLALYLLDGVVHDPHAPERPPVIQFFHQRMQSAVAEIERTEVTEGAVIWKLYDHGFVVRTKTATLAFDIIYASYLPGFAVPGDLMTRLIGQCDVLFVSHQHGDHCDPDVIRAFAKAGKPVMLPPGVVVDDVPEGAVKQLDRTTDREHEVSIKAGAATLKVIAFPGHQGKLENNVYLVTTPDGLSFGHMGDQHNYPDLDWIAKIGETHRVDVLMPNCWTSGLAQTVAGFDPQLVITGHENELGHSIDHREAYWKSYRLLDGIETPWILMTWGESYHYRRK
ncbi:MAG: MBL fold metallo-hydrolase [bacterium]|nr:MBL fold metallo-hydrolase [bacterium]